jgi:Icc-related predicted phosphoesterase
MKVAVCSDLHLEFGDLTLKNEENADVLILGGDILIASEFEYFNPNGEDHSNAEQRARKYYNFLKNCCAEFPKVLMVMGNHEHYHGDFKYSFEFISNATKDLENFFLLDKESMLIDGYMFFCGSLWTDMNNEDRYTMKAISGMMSDYRLCNNSHNMVSFKVYDDGGKIVFRERPAKFTPEDSVADHKKFLVKLSKCLENNSITPFIVVGHHAPSKFSTHPKYKKEKITNGAYSSDLNEFILNNRQIKLWTHGHTHEEFDYVIGTTRIVCNPRGYDGYEDRAENFKLKYVEV